MSSKCEIACLISVNTLTLLVSNKLTLTDGKNLVVQQDAFAIALKSTEQKKERLLCEDRIYSNFCCHTVTSETTMNAMTIFLYNREN